MGHVQLESSGGRRRSAQPNTEQRQGERQRGQYHYCPWACQSGMSPYPGPGYYDALVSESIGLYQNLPNELFPQRW